jgi:hypothetical protein
MYTRRSATSFILGDTGETQRLCLAVLPEKTSRHNHRMSVHTITNLLDACLPSKGNVHVVLAGVSTSTPPAPLAAAVARAFPLYSVKTNKGKPKDEPGRNIHITFADASGETVHDGVHKFSQVRVYSIKNLLYKAKVAL